MALALIVADFASRRFRRQNSSMLSPVAGRLPHMNPMSLQFAASMLAAEVFRNGHRPYLYSPIPLEIFFQCLAVADGGQPVEENPRVRPKTALELL